jgi:hypothetical protein
MTNELRAKMNELRAAVESGSTKHARATVGEYIVIAQLTDARLRNVRYARVDVYGADGKRLKRAELA